MGERLNQFPGNLAFSLIFHVFPGFPRYMNSANKTSISLSLLTAYVTVSADLLTEEEFNQKPAG